MAAYVIGEHLTSPGFPVSETEACFRNWLFEHDEGIALQRVTDLQARIRGAVSDYEEQYRRADAANTTLDSINDRIDDEAYDNPTSALESIQLSLEITGRKVWSGDE